MRFNRAGLVRRGAALAMALSLLPGVAAPPAALAGGVGTTPSSTALSVPSLDPKPEGRISDLTASVTPGATGTVTFNDNGTDTPVALVGSTALYQLGPAASPGVHAIKAVYGGDGTYAGSESATVNVTVGPRQATVTLTLSGPHDATGATAQKGDILGATVKVVDAVGSSLTPDGTIDLKVDGVVKTSFPVVTVTPAQLDTSEWTLGTHTVSAVYKPSGADFAAAEDSHDVNVVANMVEAVGFNATYTTVYPYKDGYRDTTTLRGRRDEPATVRVMVYNASAKKVFDKSVPLGTGAWGVAWNGRTSAGTMLPAGKYTVKQRVTDALGLSRTLPSTYVTLSAKRLYTYTKVLKKDYAHRSAQSTHAIAWQFTLPSATVYKKLVFATYAKSAAGGGFGPHDFAACPKATWDTSCAYPIASIGSTFAWRSVTGVVARNRASTYVRLYAASSTRTNLKYGRVTVTYGILR
jgi:hypothetical protein